MGIKTIVATVALSPLLGMSNAVMAEGDSLLTQLGKNAEYTFDASMLIFNQDPASDDANDDSIHSLIRQSIKSQASLSDTLTLDMDLRAIITSQPGDYAGVFREAGTEKRRGESLDFNTLFLTYSSDDFDLIIGKEIIDVGVAESNSPANRFGLADGSNPMDAKKFGVWHVGINYFIEDDTLSFKVIPFHERATLPAKRSRWLGNSPDGDFRAVTIPGPGGATVTDPQIQDDYNHFSEVNRWGYLLEYSGVREGYDFFTVIHHGPSIYPVLKRVDGTANEFEKIDPQAWSFGGGISKVSEEWTYYAETLVQITQGGKDEDFIRTSVGLTYRDTEFANKIGLQEIKPFIEYSGDRTIARQSAPGYVVSSKESRPFNTAIAMRVEVQATDKWSYAAGTVLNYDDGDRSIGIGGEYRPDDNTKVSLTWTNFLGNEDTHFGRWSENNNFKAGIEYKF